MNIVALQIDIQWENKAANFDKVHQLLSRAAPATNSLCVLPEMFATGFSMKAVPESPGGETEQFLIGMAKEFQVCIVAGMSLLGRDGQPRNMAMGYSPDGKLLADYAKMRPFSLGGEAKRYTPGEKPAVFNWQGWKVAPFVCYDLRFPEIFRLTSAEHRPHLFTVIANWPQKRIHHWVRLLQARAIENQACVVGVNRCGRDPDHVYNGRSVIIDVHGEIIADAGDGEGWISGCCELDTLEK